jgi:hypothetical protein
MISARLALLRQAQQYFHLLLLGVVKWDDVIVDKPIPVPAIKGQRDQGAVRDIVVAHFDGFRMEIISPFESEAWPLGRVKVSRGAHEIEAPLDAVSWTKIADFIKEEKQKGDDYGRIASGEAWGH